MLTYAHLAGSVRLVVGWLVCDSGPVAANSNGVKWEGFFRLGDSVSQIGVPDGRKNGLQPLKRKVPAGLVRPVLHYGDRYSLHKWDGGWTLNTTLSANTGYA